ncbi:MAG TPA: RloB domain-containing protein [Nannocystis exedens]|nr:RloB domain-containing protein [Nannocystis exedens]
MTRSRKFKRKPRPLTRSSGTRDCQTKLLVLCEGNTEARLLKDLRGDWKIRALDIRVLGRQGVPMTIVKKADKLRRTHGRNRTLWPETWAVFDRDEHKCYYDAIQWAKSKDLKLAHSNPCFELWAILLYRDQSADLHRHKAQRELKTLHPGYHHKKNPYLDFKKILDRLEIAQQRAINLDHRARDAGDPHGCPTTRFPDLLARIESLRRE